MGMPDRLRWTRVGKGVYDNGLISKSSMTFIPALDRFLSRYVQHPIIYSNHNVCKLGRFNRLSAAVPAVPSQELRLSLLGLFAVLSSAPQYS